MKKTKKVKNILVFFVLIVFISSNFSINCLAENKKDNNNNLNGFTRENSYDDYINKHDKNIKPNTDLIIKGGNIVLDDSKDVKVLKELEGEENVVVWNNEEGFAEWNLNVKEEGFYNISIKYLPIKFKNRDIELNFTIDGKIPFNGAERLRFSRIWKDSEEIIQDASGNDLRPKMEEVFKWKENHFHDSEGLYNDPYSFYFEKGKHKIKLTSVRELMAISEIKLHQVEKSCDYKNEEEQYSKKGYKETQGIYEKIQAEKTYEKSHTILYPMYDRSSPATEPSHPSKIRLNTIGQLNWKHPGEWVTWKINVPEDGLYNIGFKVRQNFSRGMTNCRKLYIDGKVPFSELENVKFKYSNKWYNKVLGDENPYLIYLTKGSHEVTLEVTLGELSETLRTIEDTVYRMNYIYRKIIMITGTTPDKLRDYNLDKEIPGLIENFEQISSALEKESKRIEKITGSTGTEASLLDEVRNQLNEFIEKPYEIPERLSKYKDNVSSMGALILKLKEQPLEIDYLVVCSPNKKLESPKSSIFSKIAFDTKAFIASFVEKYNTLGSVEEGDKSIEVWASAKDMVVGTTTASGRDQAQLIRRLIDDTFTPQTGIKVNLSLVNGDSTLIQATLAGKNPDVAMLVPKETPINLAMRGALNDLSQFSELDKLRENYVKTAFIPYEYNGGCYALPETQNFNMMFYRKDIFEELCIEPPKTWQEFYSIIPIIQKNNMQVGIAESQVVFETLVFQNNSNFYKKDMKATAFDESQNINAFKQWTGFYNQYGLERVFDFYNRFRTGEMPLSIQPYTMYNMLSVAAPELANLWEMVPIPGTMKNNGSVNRAESSNGTSCIMLKNVKNKDSAFEFMKWWTSTETQAAYGTEIESLMGPAARYDTANVEAFAKLPWNKSEARNLREQWKDVTDIPQIPGNYYITRNVSNAFRSVVDDNKNPRETLNKFNKDMNEEISRKRKEFGLDE